jgi:hypothetical protein
MATTAMSTYSYSILVKEGMHPPVTRTVNGADIFPGMPVTCNGETFPDVCLPDARGESVFGVTGLLETQDIDTVYANNAEIPIYLTGSGAQVRMYASATSGATITAGDIMVVDATAAVGYVETLMKAMDALVADYTSTLLATTITRLFEIVGRAMETSASTGNARPIKVMLSI